MKILFRYIPILMLGTTLFSCKKDNFEAPSSLLTGHLVYQGEQVQVARNQVPFQLFEYGFGKVGPLNAAPAGTNAQNFAQTTFAQDGSFSEVLFNGTYKFIIPNGQGPFLWKQTASGTPDTTVITLNGNQTVDLEVTPYYMVRNAAFTASGGNVAATFKADKIITGATGKDIESVSLFINKTQFVSGNGDDNLKSTVLAGASITDPANISLTAAIPTIVPTQTYVFVRVGLKIAGVEDMIFSPVQKISL